MKIIFSIKRHILIICGILVAAHVLLPGPLWANAFRVAVFPFQINAAKDYSFLQKGIADMLSSRLNWEDKVLVISREETQAALKQMPADVTENSARQLGSKLSADFVLFGSLTIIGSSVSMDAKMLDVSGKRAPLTFFDQSPDMDGVIPRINLFAQQINEKLFNRTSTARPQPKTQTPQAPSIYTHPEKLFEKELGGTATGESSSLIISQQDAGASTFKKSRNLPLQLSGIALGDVDGDKKIETVLLAEDRLLIVRFQNDQMYQIKELKGKPHLKYFSVDVADIKADGSAEIFVSVMNTLARSLESFVLEWDGTDFRRIVQNEPWYFKVLHLPKRGSVLYGQQKGFTELFSFSVHELFWNGRQYGSRNKIYLPNGVNIHSFSMGNFVNRSVESLVVLDEDDQLVLYSTAGRQEWISDEKYGGNEKSLSYPYTEDSDYDRDSESLLYLPHRLLVVDLNRDGIHEVVLVKHDSLTSRVLGKYRRYTGANLVSLVWNGHSLSQNWRTRKISGYVSDYAIGDLDNNGSLDLVGVDVSEREGLFAKGKSAVIWFDLKAVTAKPATQE